MIKISLIIPIFNEADTILDLLNYLLINTTKNKVSEIIIVDGGSTDGCQSIVTNFIALNQENKPNQSNIKHSRIGADSPPDIKLLHSEKGRAIQMNFGAKKSRENILYFLHADSFPPKDFAQLIINETKKGQLAGCFKMKFNSTHWWLQLAGWFTQFSWKACRGGDQSLFVSKFLFYQLNGFNEAFFIYEDYELINKLYAKKQFVVIQKWLITSARRYRINGIWKLQFHFWAIYIKKYLGASASELFSYYNKHINVKM